MHHEHATAPNQEPNNIDRPQHGSDREQVGDIYAVDIEPDGVQRIEKLQPQPAIWACSLADYNAGLLHGVWLDADQEPAELRDAVAGMLAASPTNPKAEEWAIFEYEGFGVLRLDEHENLDTVSRLARGLVAHGPAFASWAEHVGHDSDELDRFDEAFLGEWPSVEAYAEHLFDDLGYVDLIDRTIPSNLRPYVQLDSAAFARDLQIGGDVFTETARTGVWIFDART